MVFNSVSVLRLGIVFLCAVLSWQFFSQYLAALDQKNGFSGSTIVIMTFSLPSLSWPYFLLKQCCLPYVVEAYFAHRLFAHFIPKGALNISLVPRVPNYSLPSSWAARGILGGKHGGSIVPPTRGSANLDPENEDHASADCFYIHPTTVYVPPSSSAKSKFNVDVGDPVGRYIFSNGMLATQASAFNHVCKVYAPYYREMVGSVYYSDAFSSRNQAMAIAYQDVRSAFLYFLRHWNKPGQGQEERPIFLVSHSQGTEHAVRLLDEFFKPGTALLNRLVAAYLPGMQIPDWTWRKKLVGKETLNFPRLVLELDGIDLCWEPNSTRCIVSWNTLSFDAKNELFYLQPAWSLLRLNNYPQSQHVRPVCTNPLSWKTTLALDPEDGVPADECVQRSRNKGSYFLLQLRQSFSYLMGKGPGSYDIINHLGPLPLAEEVVGACCRDGYNRVDHPGLSWEYFLFPVWSAFSFPGGNYHSYDFAFYYASIRKNAKERMEAYHKTLWA